MISIYWLCYSLMPSAEKLIELEIFYCNCDNLSDLISEMSSLRKLHLRSCDLTDLPQRCVHLSTSLLPEFEAVLFSQPQGVITRCWDIAPLLAWDRFVNWNSSNFKYWYLNIMSWLTFYSVIVCYTVMQVDEDNCFVSLTWCKGKTIL